MGDFPEADWKVLRSLKDLALERFCKRVLDELAPLAVGEEGSPKTYHQRYLEAFKVIHRRNDELGDAFNDLRRSMAMIQLTYWRRLKLLTEEEFSRFSEHIREAVEMFLRS